VCLLVLLVTVPVLPGTLMSVTPTGASSGVLVNVTGTGFSTTAAQNVVTFTPAAGGSAQTGAASTVATIDATRGIRRLTVRVPNGLPAGRCRRTSHRPRCSSRTTPRWAPYPWTRSGRSP
jgi:hypothetical protein